MTGRVHGQPLPRFIPCLEGRQWGYCDSNKQMLIAPQWDQAYFFYGGKAITRLGEEYRLIDTLGRYIIPPERHWNGVLMNSITHNYLNSHDSEGRWGLIDGDNRIIIPFLYDAPTKNYPENELNQRFMPYGNNGAVYHMARRHGMMGLINGDGRALVPFEYEKLTDVVLYHNYRKDAPLKYLYATKAGKCGIIDTAGRVIIPFAWKELKRLGDTKYLVATSDAGKGVLNMETGAMVVPAIYDDVTERNPCFNCKPVGVELKKNGKQGWADLANGTIIEPEWDFVEEYGEGLYAVYTSHDASTRRKGIVDRKGNLLVPCIYDYVSKTGDTIQGTRILTKRDRVGKLISTKCTFQLYLIKGGKVKRGKSGRSQWMEPIAIEHKRGNWCGTSNNFNSYTYSEPVYITKGGAKMNFFKKDSLEYEVVKKDGDTYAYVVQTIRNPVGKPSCFAVVDTNLNYIVPPQNKYVLTGSNLKLGVLVAMEHGLYGVVNTALEVVLPFQQLQIKNTFKWRGRWYAIAIDSVRAWERRQFRWNENGPIPEYWGPQVIINDAGIRVMKPAHRLDFFTDSVGNRRDNWQTGYVMLRDSANKRAVADVSGRLLHPALSFKYSQLEHAWNGLFYHECMGCANGYRAVVDGNDRDIFGGRLSISEVSTYISEPYGKVYDSNGNTVREDLPLTQLNAKDRENGRELKVYKDRHGTVYFK